VKNALQMYIQCNFFTDLGYIINMLFIDF